MVSIVDLWLPVVFSAGAVFFLSFLMHMVLPHHRTDYGRLPDEDGLVKELERQGAEPGMYAFPHCATPSQMQDPEWVVKFTQHPAGLVTLKGRGGINMGKSMATSLLFNLAISALVAYLASQALSAGSPGRTVLQVTSLVAWLGYGGALAWGPIWFFERWGVAFKGILDALVYGLATGLIFMALWPGAS